MTNFTDALQRRAACSCVCGAHDGNSECYCGNGCNCGVQDSDVVRAQSIAKLFEFRPPVPEADRTPTSCCFGDSAGKALLLDHVSRDLILKNPPAEFFTNHQRTAWREDQFIKPGDVRASVRPPDRPVIVDGLLRQNEIMNVIAAPKVGKTWLMLGLAQAIATGNAWLGRKTDKRRVLYVDNELHRETASSRLWSLVRATGQAENSIFLLSLRESPRNLYEFQFDVNLDAWRGSVIVLDALYKLYPVGISENDNAQIARFYSQLDELAQRYDLTFVLVHHLSKGDQSTKATTDLGAGAGSMSRAADTLVAIRQTNFENHFQVDVETRSFDTRWPKTVIQRCQSGGAMVFDLAKHDAEKFSLKGPRTVVHAETLLNCPETLEKLASLLVKDVLPLIPESPAYATRLQLHQAIREKYNGAALPDRKIDALLRECRSTPGVKAFKVSRQDAYQRTCSAETRT